MFLYFVGSHRQSFNDAFDAYRLLYLFMGLATLFAALYLTNRGMVSRETLSGAEKPMVEPSVRRNNRLFVGVAIGVYRADRVVLSAAGAAGRGGEQVRSLAVRLFSGSGGQQEPPPAAGRSAAARFPPPDGKTKTLPAWVDYIMYGIVIAIRPGAAVSAVAARQPAAGLAERLRQRFLKLFDRDKGGSARGYVDEVERINKTERSFANGLAATRKNGSNGRT